MRKGEGIEDKGLTIHCVLLRMPQRQRNDLDEEKSVSRGQGTREARQDGETAGPTAARSAGRPGCLDEQVGKLETYRGA